MLHKLFFQLERKGPIMNYLSDGPEDKGMTHFALNLLGHHTFLQYSEIPNFSNNGKLSKCDEKLSVMLGHGTYLSHFVGS